MTIILGRSSYESFREELMDVTQQRLMVISRQTTARIYNMVTDHLGGAGDISNYNMDMVFFLIYEDIYEEVVRISEREVLEELDFRSYIYMLDKDGEPLLESNRNREAIIDDSVGEGSEGEFFQKILENEEENEDERRMYDGEEDRPIGRLARVEASGYISYYRGEDEYLAAYSIVPATGWIIIVDGLKSDFLAPANKVRDDMILLGLIGIIIAIIISIFISRYISKPIKNIMSFANEISDGNFDVTPLKTKSKDEIGELVIYLNNMRANLETSFSKLKSFSKGLEFKVKEKTADIRNLLDNAGQGFLSFGGDLMVHGEYSCQCEALFSQDIEGYNIAHLLSCDKEGEDFLRDILTEITSKDKSMGEVGLYLPLLPEEIELNGRRLELEFKIIRELEEDRILMLVITDITDKRELQSQVEKERNRLKKAVNVIVNFNDFVELTDSYKDFVSRGIDELLSSNEEVGLVVEELYRKVHTFKGNFSQLAMNGLVSSLHNLETDISSWKGIEGFDEQKLRRLMANYDLMSLLTDELFNLKDVLGEDFIDQKKRIRVSIVRLKEIEAKAKKYLSPKDLDKILPELKRLRYQPIRDLFKFYPDYVKGLAKKLEKLLKPFEIKGGDELVDLERYSQFSKSLVHIFRNGVDHGIESPNQRIRKGKSEYGKISCKIRSLDNKIEVSISDDGRGIHLDKIKDKAVQRGLYSLEEVELLSRDDSLNLIFNQELSTKDDITQLSGRGVGLAVVKEEVERLGGSISIETSFGEGTLFKITLPILD